jgi:hypothetical protein
MKNKNKKNRNEVSNNWTVLGGTRYEAGELEGGRGVGGHRKLMLANYIPPNKYFTCTQVKRT